MSDTCTLCRRRPRVGRWSWCRKCLIDVTRGIRRRREASWRLDPLDDGRRDPLDKAVA